MGSWMKADDVGVQSHLSTKAKVCGRCLVGANVFEDNLQYAGQCTRAIPMRHCSVAPRALLDHQWR